MNTRLLDYIEAGKTLGVEERLEAARQLVLSVEQPQDVEQEEVEAAWNQTIARRVDEIIAGTAAIVNGREAHEQVRARLHAQRA